ncbi:gephyrin-like molybdotransferase Glp [Nocardioides jishulii]|uniref:Molybdopterin molybdenumtransferase n=1 Tax=Nocardioides jishulii TaxID=2575440 RepID=A0A4U2YUZ7_9ACTN|nr:gephyrin-like molybdotransferase Glp [Nocardioides jishulii]QCX28545.1 molybdopterin molybdotransferase MoeA [Nocardioides jishulii]TKI64562.1 molybdopterin molybdotransferase MoeA [Nocardioides jishulii]
MPEAPSDVTSVDELVSRIVSSVSPLADFPLPLMEAFGMAIAEDVVAEVALPSFDNSAMDGYAVRAADVAGATADAPVRLPVVGEISAGRAAHLALSPGTAVKIMTGAPVPAGADTVVPYEWTDRGVATVRIERGADAGANIRRAGEAVQAGDLVVEHGTVLGPRHLGLLASIGRATVRSRPRPRVVVISTGSELRDPGTPLGHDSIYDGNSYLLAAAARQAGATAYRVGIVPDDVRSFTEALSDQLVRADLVITSGGVSEGDYDVVKEALGGLGTVWFGKVAMQPGRPQGFGVVGEDEVPIFTLPGNPVSAYVSFETFVLPALRTMMGKSPASRPTRRARLTEPITSTPGKRQLVRAVHGADRGGAWVTPVGGHGSHMIGDLAASNALVVVPEESTGVSAGEMVQVLCLDEDF